MQKDLREVIKNWGLQDKVSVLEQLVLCPDCLGVGALHRRTMADYHKGVWDEWDEPCDKCNSTGRVYNQTLSLHGFRPFKEAENK